MQPYVYKMLEFEHLTLRLVGGSLFSLETLISSLNFWLFANLKTFLTSQASPCLLTNGWIERNMTDRNSNIDNSNFSCT